MTRIPDKLSDYFWRKGIAPDWIRYQLLTSDSFSLIGDSTLPLNRLDYPSLEFEMARLGEKGIPGFLHRLSAHMNTEDVASVMGPEYFKSAELLLHTELMLDKDPLTRRWGELIEQRDPAFRQAYDRAGDRFHQTCLRYSDSDRVRYSYATFLAKTMRFKEAADIYQELLSRDPDYRSANYLLGLCHERLGEFDLANDDYRRQLEVTPGDSNAMYRLSRVAYRQGDIMQATHLLREAIRIKPDARRYFQLAKVLQRSGDDTGARRAWQQGAQLDSRNSRDIGGQGKDELIEPE
jgi:tetratricopeptide (TPR) repeat protein